MDDFLDINSSACQGVLAVHIVFVIISYAMYVMVAWSTYSPPFMFYQHYFSAIASGLYCLAISTNYVHTLVIQAIFGGFAIVCNCFYLAQSMGGSWTGNFDGTKQYPFGFSPKTFEITAYNQTEYDFAYGIFVGDIVLTFCVLFIQNVILNLILPVVMYHFMAERANAQDRNCNWNCQQKSPSRVTMTVLGGIVVAIGAVEGVISMYLAASGTIVLTQTTNPMYLLLFMVTCGMYPPHRIDHQRVATYEDQVYEETRPGWTTGLYLTFFAIIWLLAGGNISINATWSNYNELGGYLCPSLENVTDTLSGGRNLTYYDLQIVTWDNLTGIVSQSGYPGRVQKTQESIQAVTSFTCLDIWFNWIILMLSLAMFITAIYVTVMKSRKGS